MTTEQRKEKILRDLDDAIMLLKRGKGESWHGYCCEDLIDRAIYWLEHVSL